LQQTKAPSDPRGFLFFAMKDTRSGLRFRRGIVILDCNDNKEASMTIQISRAWRMAALIACAAVPAQTQAQDANAARALAATCFTCHGTDGRSVGGVPPSLAGQNKAVMLQQLKDFKEGKRPGTIMPQHAKGYTDAQLEQIAGYFAALKP
jgi:cytochrome subunit of sulfide dehydrogenase